MKRFGDSLKNCIYAVIRRRAVNALVRMVLKPFSRFLPEGLIGRIPVVGDIRIVTADARSLVLCSDGSDQLASRLYWNGLDSYEPGTVRVFSMLVRDGSTVFDVGANSGLFALLAALREPRTQAHAFEPLARAYAFLAGNIARNGLANVSAVQAVVTDRPGRVALYEPRTVMLPSSASLIRGFVPDETVEVMVQAVTLDQYVMDKEIGRVDLLKVDVEGAEYGVLEGATDLIRRDKPAIICEVLRGLADARLGGFLAEHGYRIFRITREGLVPETGVAGGATEEEWNYLFFPEGRSAGELNDIMASIRSDTAVTA